MCLQFSISLPIFNENSPSTSCTTSGTDVCASGERYENYKINNNNGASSRFFYDRIYYNRNAHCSLLLSSSGGWKSNCLRYGELRVTNQKRKKQRGRVCLTNDRLKGKRKQIAVCNTRRKGYNRITRICMRWLLRLLQPKCAEPCAGNWRNQKESSGERSAWLMLSKSGLKKN